VILRNIDYRDHYARQGLCQVFYSIEAIVSASFTKEAVMLVSIDHPTILREYKSITVAR
jgi:hypothetical protein